MISLKLFLVCVDGDVKLENGSIPLIFWNNTWSPICGHHFWNSHEGATKFCEKLGCYFGGKVFPLYGNHRIQDENTTYEVDAYQVGECMHNDVWRKCSGGCNGRKIGGICEHCQDVGIMESCSAGQPVKITISCPYCCAKSSSCVVDHKKVMEN